MKMRIFWISLIVGFIVGTIVGGIVMIRIMFYAPQQGSERLPVVSDVSITSSLPSIFDIQEELNRRGYGLKVDGEPGPKTRAAWDEALCDEHATKAIKEALERE